MTNNSKLMYKFPKINVKNDKLGKAILIPLKNKL